MLADVKRAALITICVLSAVLGLWHLQLAMQAIFVLRQGEPITPWLAILLGPAATLLLGITAIFLRKVGGIALIACGIASLAFLTLDPGSSWEDIPAFLLQISLPMIAVGIAYLFLSKATFRHAPDIPA
jgi:hypothetical protein